MSTERPVNLSINPSRFHFPLPALASITHRLTGVLLFFGIAAGLYLLNVALSSPAGFDAAMQIMSGTLAKLIAWACCVALAFHFFAGIKHLLLDLHIGDTISGALTGTWVVIAVSAVSAVIIGAWLW